MQLINPLSMVVLATLVLFMQSSVAQVTAVIAPKKSAPSGCILSGTGIYEVSQEAIVGTSKRSQAIQRFAVQIDDGHPGSIYVSNSDVSKRDEPRGNLTITLKNGVLTDGIGRTGYIADNYQFQYDKPAQHGALFTGGFSICPNGSIALGDSAVFWSCNSGAFSNLYDRWWAAQCLPVHLVAHDITLAASTASFTPLSVASTGNAAVLGGSTLPTFTASATTEVTITTSFVTAGNFSAKSNSTVAITSTSTAPGSLSSTSAMASSALAASTGKSSGNVAVPAVSLHPTGFALFAGLLGVAMI